MSPSRRSGAMTTWSSLRRLPRRSIASAILSALAVILLACGASSTQDPGTPSAPPAPSQLDGTTWTVISVGGRNSVPDHRPTVTFADHRVQGSGGCNSYGGSFNYFGDTATLEIGETMSTTMGCIGPQGDFEGVFLGAFTGKLTAAYAPDPNDPTVKTDQLVLTGPKGAILLAPVCCGG
jgi:heat shock protein HslJ